MAKEALAACGIPAAYIKELEDLVRRYSPGTFNDPPHRARVEIHRIQNSLDFSTQGTGLSTGFQQALTSFRSFASPARRRRHMHDPEEP